MLHNVVCRGYTTCEQLQDMHNTAVAERTRLRLEAHTNQQHEAQRARDAARCELIRGEALRRRPGF